MNKKEPDEIQASEGIQSDLTDFERLGKKKNRRSKKILGAVFVISVLFLAVYFNGVKKKVESVIGPASPALSRFQQFRLIIRLEPELSRLTGPASDKIDQTLLSVRSGETPAEIARELKEKQVLSDEDLFLRYLIYSGADRQLKPGRYIIPAGSNIPEIGKVLTDTGNSLVEFSILNGMRLEEIAALLPSSGLSISPEDFLQAARNYPGDLHPAGGTDLEGYIPAGSYIVARSISVQNFLKGFTDTFNQKLTREVAEGLQRKGLSVAEGVTLASIVSREAMSSEEYGLIASVFLNRYRLGMPFQSDPTVQYAIGWDETEKTWWKNPLASSDLLIQSPYNTYIYNGFPPTPICNFDFEVLEAVANAPETDYYYFRMRCDGSPFHNFAETYAEHVANACTKEETATPFEINQ